MARRVALARAIALDPMLVMYDEPFAGLDPISLGVVGQLIRKLNDALGITSVVVTHDVYESLKIVDYLYFVSEGRIIAQGTPDRGARVDRSVRAPVRRRRSPTARCRSTTRRAPLRRGALARAALAAFAAALRRVGASTIRAIVARSASRRASSSRCCCKTPAAFRAPAAHAARDLLLRACCRSSSSWCPACSSAWCSALQGYDVLQRYGAERVARHPRRAVARARARAGRRGSAVREPRRQRDHRRDRPHEGDRAALGDGDDGGRSAGARRRAAVLGRRDLDAAARGAVLDASASSAPTSSA